MPRIPSPFRAAHPPVHRSTLSRLGAGLAILVRLTLPDQRYHLQRTHGELMPTIVATAAITSHYQIADAPDRTEPGTGESDYANVLRAIAATGYDGFVGCAYRPSGRNRDAFAWMDAMGATRA